MRLEDQTKEAFQEDFGVMPQTSEPKGKGYIELLVDNIVGLDNEYESFGEAFGKSFNEDELGTLKNMAVSAYEGAKEFVTSPIETTKDVATEISDSVSRLGAESLDGRIKRMYGVGYQDATEEQVTRAREAVIGDAITASSLVPAAKGATTVAKAAIPGKIQADVVGQMRSLIDGDKEFRTESKNPPVGLSAQATGAGPATPKKTIPFFQKKEVAPNAPDAVFGTKRISDIFKEDKLDKLYLDEASEINSAGIGDEEGSWALNDDPDAYDINTLGYARNISIDDLARLRLGEVSMEEVVDQYGNDPTPEVLDYVTNRLTRLSNNPEFVDYVNKRRENPDFDPFGARDNSPEGNKTVFRSPIPEALSGMEWPSKGKEGYQILSELKGNPSVRKSELDTVVTEIDPKKRYSLDEVQELVSGNLWNTEVRVLSSKMSSDAQFGLENYVGPKFESYQRQVDLQDPEEEYFELLIDSNREGDKPNFEAKSQHFNPSTIAHTRASVRVDNRGEYILPEEFQADLLQKGYSEPRAKRGKVSPAEAVEKKKNILTTYGGYDESDMELLKIFGEDHFYSEYYDQVPNSIENFVEKIGPEKLLPGKTKDEVLDIINSSGSPSDSLIGLYANYKAGFKNTNSELNDMLGLADETPTGARGLMPTSDEAWEYYDSIKDTYFNNINDEISIYEEPGASAPPIKKIEESVKLTLGALIAEADKRGIDRIVIPPFERIVAKRFRPGSEGYKKALDPKSGFYKTYVKSTQAAIKDLEEEFGRGNISSRPVDMNYEPLGYVTDTATKETVDLPVTGTEINFKGLRESGYDLKRLRFAEGGMVEEDQMNRLMQEGGIADDGMTREPVTGNEIPPGSMASEVRDDIPAQLSEGEYIVPADVVRFFGVRFFEDLRNQAKQGLAEMDADGRIGGTPVDAQGVPVEGQDEELSPEEQQMLMEALGASGGAGMAYGGMVGNQPLSNPYQDQATMYQMPAGMAEGGDTSGFDRTQFSLGTGQAGIQQRKYINPTTKEERTINFLNDTPLGIVPEGFVPWTQELADAVKAPETETPTTATEKVEREGRDRDQQGTGTAENSYESWAKENYDAITSDPYSFGVNAINEASKKSTGFGRVFSGGIIGDIQKLDAISDAQAALSRVTDAAQKQDLQSRIDALTGSLSSPIVGFMTDIGFTATGKQKNAAIDSIAGATASARTGTAPSTGTTSAGGGRSIPGGVTRSGGRDQQGSTGTSAGTSPGRADRDQQGSTGTSAGGNKSVGGTGGGGGAQQGQAAEKDDSKSYGGQAASDRSGGRYVSGGLVSKKAATKRDKKGLAS